MDPKRDADYLGVSFRSKLFDAQVDADKILCTHRTGHAVKGLTDTMDDVCVYDWLATV